MSYTFGNVLVANVGLNVALPYGSWKLYWGATAGATTTALTTLATVTNKAPNEISGSDRDRGPEVNMSSCSRIRRRLRNGPVDPGVTLVESASSFCSAGS